MKEGFPAPSLQTIGCTRDKSQQNSDPQAFRTVIALLKGTQGRPTGFQICTLRQRDLEQAFCLASSENKFMQITPLARA